MRRFGRDRHGFLQAGADIGLGPVGPGAGERVLRQAGAGMGDEGQRIAVLVFGPVGLGLHPVHFGDRDGFGRPVTARGIRRGGAFGIILGRGGEGRFGRGIAGAAQRVSSSSS